MRQQGYALPWCTEHCSQVLGEIDRRDRRAAMRMICISEHSGEWHHRQMLHSGTRGGTDRTGVARNDCTQGAQRQKLSLALGSRSDVGSPVCSPFVEAMTSARFQVCGRGVELFARNVPGCSKKFCC